MRKLAKWILCLFAILLLPHLAILSYPPLRHYVYKETLFLDLLADYGNSNSPELKAMEINALLIDRLRKIPDTDSIDIDSYNDFFRGVAWCDQLAWTLGHLMGRGGVDNRMVMTEAPDGISKHTFSELRFGKKWVYFDPTLGISGFDISENNPPSYSELCEHADQFISSSFFDGTRKYAPRLVNDLFAYWKSEIFYPNCHKPRVWGNPFKKKDFLRKVVFEMVRFYDLVLGENFRNYYQDIYLKLAKGRRLKMDYPLDLKRERDRAFYEARNLQLFSRYPKAITKYETALALLPEGPLKEEAYFFYARSLLKNNDFERAIQMANERLKSRYKTRWFPYYYNILGYAEEGRGNYVAATKAFHKFIDFVDETEKQGGPLLFRVFTISNKLKQMEENLPS